VDSRDGVTPLAVLGFDAADEDLYRVLLRMTPVGYAALAEVVGEPVEQVEVQVARFVARGLVEVAGETVVAVPPEEAIAQIVAEETRRLRSVRDQLDALGRMLPSLAAEHMNAPALHGRPVGLEVVRNDQIVDVVRALTARASGDLLWIRPDQWRIPEGRSIDRWVEELLRAGRRSRVIYPARALEEAPDAVRRRAELGEHVRILADVPGRLAVLGDAAVMRERFTGASDRVLIVRQPALVDALRALFEELWQRALAVPGLESEREEAARATNRRLLLEQLARGAKDEQIARALGLSLRTVRRRVADVLEDLGADSRFQAGVEAVRRGWI
jgi:hypothetical protein